MTWINEWLGHDRLCHVSHVSMLQRKRDRTGLQSKKTTKVNWSRYCRHNPKMPFSAWSNEEVISNTESAYVTSLKIIRRELQSGKKKISYPHEDVDGLIYIFETISSSLFRVLWLQVGHDTQMMSNEYVNHGCLVLCEQQVNDYELTINKRQ